MEGYLEYINNLGLRIKETWLKLTMNQKLLIGGAFLLVVVAIVFLLNTGNTNSEYEVLYTDLSQKDAAAIVAKLDEENNKYKLQDEASTILVPPGDKYSIRLKLASENLPAGTAGFELFQEKSFGETQSDKRVKYQVALTGELVRTIESLEKVKSARVHLVIPEKTLFSDDEEKATASVKIRCEDSEDLSPNEIKGIINLIANSVEGLNPENVIIIDSNGKLLSDKMDDHTEDMTDLIRQQLVMKNEYEKQKQQAIQTMLDTTIGKSNSVVRVSAELDFDSIEKKTEKFSHDPEGPFVVSEHVLKESGTGMQSKAQQPAGTDTNIPQYAEVADNTGSSSFDKSEKTRNYENNKTETLTSYAVGDIKYDYLTVSVLVNNKVAENLGETDEERTGKIRNIVATACGLREGRDNEDVDLSNSISVAFIDFYAEKDPAVSDSKELEGLQKWMQSPITIGLTAGLFLVFIALLWFLFKRRRSPKEEKIEEKDGFEAVADEEISVEELFEERMSSEDRENQKIREEIEKVIEENPDNAAQVIRTWLMEDQR